MSPWSSLMAGCRRALARMLRGRFPGLYSTVDYPDEVPVQMAAYDLAITRYLRRTDSLLDVGFGLGYGLKRLTGKAASLAGIEIDSRAVSLTRRLLSDLPGLLEVRAYDGKHIPYESGSFDLVTCVDVIEHVPDYRGLIEEMLRVSRRTVFFSTPCRRKDHSLPDGAPRNYWHLREWTPEELAAILERTSSESWQLNFINGPWEGPFTYSTTRQPDTMAMTPVLYRRKEGTA